MTVQIQDSQIEAIIQQVMAQLGSANGANGRSPSPLPRAAHFRGVFATPDEAVKAAHVALARFRRVSLTQRKAIIQAMREAAIENAQKLAQTAVQETHMGRVSDKVLKNLLVAEKTPGVEILPNDAYVGDDGLTLEECAPFGVILAVTPVTNPTATVINNAISMVAAGNTVVFAPHPASQNTSLMAMDILNEAIESAGGPPNLLVAAAEATIEVAGELMHHPQINLIVTTGGPAVVDAALRSGKRAIGAAAGNPPVLVDDTADPVKAARDIILGHSFDNNMPCTSEKEVIVTAGNADALMAAFRAAGNACVLDPGRLSELERLMLNEKRSGPNRQYIGQNACVILAELGIAADEEMRAIIVEVGKDHPFVRHELMMPVLGVVRVRDFEEGVETAVEVEAGLRHSAIIHSSNIYHMSEFGRAINTTVFVKNAPSYAGLGFGGEGHTSFTIAGRTGEGMTTARTFTRIRRCTLVGAFSAV
ncbi:MAG: aldehyde dehydrogenase EutE [Chloroflexi bacterium]|nr:aldehyde dehydrogenase EutE [Chloroflexota bacterium]